MAFVFTLMLLAPTVVGAVNATAYTYTLSADWYWMKTKDAYLVDSILFGDYSLSSPEDLYVRGNKLYVTDTGHGEIVILDLETGEITAFGSDVLSMPTGVYVTQSGNIYVADMGLEKAFMFSSEGELLREYPRPTTVTYGENNVYRPMKITADEKGIVYLVGEGSFDGIIQLAPDGEFLGYFGYNQVPLTLIELLQETFFSDEQKERLFNKIPRAFSNVARDNRGLLYSVTYGSNSRERPIKKHNIAGVDMLEKNFMVADYNIADITIGRYGQIYVVNENGLVFEYDNFGNLVFSFGGQALAVERNGLFTLVSAIAVDDSDNLYVLDKERAKVHVFAPTEFAKSVHTAISLYEQGKYDESRAIWENVLQESGSTKITHLGIADCYFQTQQFEQAMENYKIAGEQGGYSNAYWEIRNEWITSNVGYIILSILLLYILLKILGAIDKRKGILNPMRKFMKKLRSNRFVSDIIFTKSFIRHPFDSYYDIRHDLQGSAKSATLLYAIGFVIFCWFMLGKGFIVNSDDASKVPLMMLAQQFFLPIGLWIVCNYMVSSINEGEGRFRDVYVLTAYALSPFIIFAPVVIIASHFITNNEIFLVTFPTTVLIGWTAIQVIVGLREIHDYEFGDIFKNILLTVFFMCVVILVFSMIQMFWDQIINLIYSIFKEVMFHVAA